MVSRRGKWSVLRDVEFSDKDLENITEYLTGMDYVRLRALIRQSAHVIDLGMQNYALRPEETRRVPKRARSMLRHALGTWEKRGYRIDSEDIKYAYEALRRGDEFEMTLTYHPSPSHVPFSESDLKAVESAIFGRRSIRRFSHIDVADDLLSRILEAAIWAPNDCSLQACRFIVVKEAETKKLLLQPWARTSPVVITVGVDERLYEFTKGNELAYNPYLDIGLAIQNMFLMAHALGLGACICTFTGELDSIRRKLKVPEYIQLITCVGLGWPEDEPTAVPRMELEEFVSREKWSLS